ICMWSGIRRSHQRSSEIPRCRPPDRRMVAVQFRCMQKSLDLYLIAAGNKRCVLFSPLDSVQTIEGETDDRVVKAITWFMRRQNRVVAWVGRVLKTAHEYYIKLE